MDKPFIEKLRPLWIELVETGVLASILALLQIPPNYMAVLLLAKTAIKSYFFKGTKIKQTEVKDMTTIPEYNYNEETQTTLSTNNKGLELARQINSLIQTNGGMPFDEKTLADQINKGIAHRRKSLREQAIAKLESAGLTEEERKALFL